MEEKKAVQNSENPKVVLSLFKTVKLSVLISPRNLYYSLKSIKEKKRTYSYIETCITEMLSRDMYEYASTFHNLLFLICSVDHGLSQILEYKNVRDIPIYMFYSFFCLCMYLYIHKQNSRRAIKDTINNTGCWMQVSMTE